MKVSPETVSLTLNEPVAEPVNVAVTDAAQEVVETAPAEIDGRTVTARLLGELEAGEYALSYRLVSADGHVVTGTLDFTVESPASSSVSPTPSPTAEPSPVPAAQDSDADRDGPPIVIWIAVALVLAVLLYFARLGLRSRRAPGDD